MMKIIALLVLAPTFAYGQYQGPAVETCHAYARRQLAQDASTAKDIVIERDASLSIERYTRKVGSQFVSSILSGNGAVVFTSAPAAELAFICLLADEKRAVFFEWLPRRDASALAQCTRDATTRAAPKPCLDTLLQISEQDLMQVYAGGLADALQRDIARGNEAASNAYRESNKAWLQYRDAECQRRKDLAPAAVDPENYRLACVVELTRRRLVDMR